MSDDVTVDSSVEGSVASFKHGILSDTVIPLDVQTLPRRKYVLLGLVALLSLLTAGGVIFGVLKASDSDSNQTGNLGNDNVAGGTTDDHNADSEDNESSHNGEDDREVETSIIANDLFDLNITRGENTAMDLAGSGLVLALLIDTESENSTETVVRVVEASSSNSLDKGWLQRGADLETGNEAEISLSVDGNFLAIGDPFVSQRQGAVCVYEWDGQEWIIQGEECILGQDGDEFGSSVQLGINGVLAACARSYCQVYDFVVGDWEPRGYNFAFSNSEVLATMSMTNDGNTILVATMQRAMVYSWDGSTWKMKGNPLQGRFNRNLKRRGRENRPGAEAVLASNNGDVVAIRRRNLGDEKRGYGGGVVVYEYSEEKGWSRRGSGCPNSEDEGRRRLITRAGGPHRPQKDSYNRGSGCSWHGCEEDGKDDNEESFTVSGDGSTVVVLGNERKLRQPNPKPRRKSTGDNIFGGEDDLQNEVQGILIFQWNGSEWNETGSVPEMSYDVFLALSDSGETLAVGRDDSVGVYSLTEF